MALNGTLVELKYALLYVYFIVNPRPTTVKMPNSAIIETKRITVCTVLQFFWIVCVSHHIVRIQWALDIKIILLGGCEIVWDP